MFTWYSVAVIIASGHLFIKVSAAVDCVPKYLVFVSHLEKPRLVSRFFCTSGSCNTAACQDKCPVHMYHDRARNRDPSRLLSLSVSIDTYTIVIFRVGLL